MNVLLDQHLQQPLPSVRTLRPELPAAADAVIAKATAKDAKDRFTDVLEVATAFHAAIEGRGRSSLATADLRNPYKGLRAFHEPDAGDFFGREVVIRRLIERLAEPSANARFLCVIGPSGSGKSSLVRAGVVPALRRGAIEGSERWFVVDLMPGAHPLRELETALLGVAVEPPPSLLDDLERDERGLARAVERILPDPDAELVIVLDQLEEVFTLVEDDSERTQLLRGIVAAAEDPSSRVRVIATLRADFYDQPLSILGFGDLLAARSEAITPMSPVQLERAIAGPAERAGLEFEPGLVAAMVADVTDRPGALPLLQYALTELAERPDGGRLTLERYRGIGGVSGALARRAEQIFVELAPAARDECRQLFLRLVTLGEGAEEARRRVRRSELVPAADASTTNGVIEIFGRHRLVSFDRDPITREPTVEIAHEALLLAWARLQGWIDEARDDLRTRNAISISATAWTAARSDESFLLRGARLEQMASWAETTSVALSPADEGFLRASVARRDDEAAAEDARRARERGLERRSVKRLRALVAVLTAGVLAAATLTVIALDRNETAQRATRLAFARELATAASANLEVDRELAVLLALESMRANDGTAFPQVEEILRRAGTVVSIDTSGILGQGVHDVAVTPDGHAVAVAADDGSVGVWDLLTGRRTFTDRSPEPCGVISCPDVRWVSMSDDASTLATVTPETSEGFNVFHVWDLASGRETFTVAPTPGAFAPGFVALSPDGSLLATAEWSTIQMYPVGTGQPMWRLRGFGSVPYLTFSPDGAHLFFGLFDLNRAPGPVSSTSRPERPRSSSRVRRSMANPRSAPMARASPSSTGTRPMPEH